jgi:DNA-binding transcriptional LysR family regulator
VNDTTFHAGEQALQALMGVRGRLAQAGPKVIRSFMPDQHREFFEELPLLFVDRVTDLVDEGIDVAIRIGALPDSSLVATGVGTMRRVVCASPAYLRAHGTPRVPADLVDHEAIAFVGAASHREWAFGPEDGRQVAVPKVRLEVNSADVAVAAACTGRGITRVLSYQIAPELRAGKLKVILADFEPPPAPVHVVHAEGRRVAARVRAFVDFAAERLRANEALG